MLNIYSCFLLNGQIITKFWMLMWILRKISITPTVRKKNVEKDFDGWDPKIQGCNNNIQSFYVAALID